MSESFGFINKKNTPSRFEENGHHKDVRVNPSDYLYYGGISYPNTEEKKPLSHSQIPSERMENNSTKEVNEKKKTEPNGNVYNENNILEVCEKMIQRNDINPKEKNKFLVIKHFFNLKNELQNTFEINDENIGKLQIYKSEDHRNAVKLYERISKICNLIKMKRYVEYIQAGYHESQNISEEYKFRVTISGDNFAVLITGYPNFYEFDEKDQTKLILDAILKMTIRL